MHIIKQEKVTLQFQSRGWDSQETTRYVIKLTTKVCVEAAVIYHYNNGQERDLTLEISSASSCPIKCSFCASGEIPLGPPLTAEEMLEQVFGMISQNEIIPLRHANLFLSFFGIGEPSIDISRIINVIQKTQEVIPHIRFNIATTGLCISELRHLLTPKITIRRIQIPFIHFNAEMTKRIFLGMKPPSTFDLLPRILDIIKFHNAHLKINYILIKNFNDSQDVIDFLINLVKPFKNEITIKLSYLNETSTSIKHGLYPLSSKEMSTIKKTFEKANVESYIFGTEYNCSVGCGQLIQPAINLERRGI